MEEKWKYLVDGKRDLFISSPLSSHSIFVCSAPVCVYWLMMTHMFRGAKRYNARDVSCEQ